MSLPLAGLIISLQLLRGDMDQVRRENPLLFGRGVAISRKLGFPDVIMPGESPLASSQVTRGALQEPHVCEGGWSSVWGGGALSCQS